MAENPPAVFLKIIWLTHFVLSSWALLSGFSGVTIYLYSHLAFLACGLWAMISIDSSDAAIMTLATLAVSVFNDILMLGLYEPRYHDLYERLPVSTSNRNEFRFALGMCITNLLLKPVSAFVLFRIYQSRASGSEFNYGIPGLDASRFGGNRGGYNDIESSPGHTSIHVRSNDPYRNNDPPLYQAPTYQEPPPLGHVDTGKS